MYINAKEALLKTSKIQLQLDEEKSRIQQSKIKSQEEEISKVLDSWTEDQIIDYVNVAVAEGKRNSYIKIYDFSSSPEIWGYPVAKKIQKFLDNLGYQTKYVEYNQEPHGSDPLFDYTIYSAGVEIKW